MDRKLIEAEVRKCFEGIDWESQNLQQIIERISENLKVYGNVDEGVIASVEEQVRKKLTDKGIVPVNLIHSNHRLNSYYVFSGTARLKCHTSEIASKITSPRRRCGRWRK